MVGGAESETSFWNFCFTTKKHQIELNIYIYSISCPIETNKIVKLKKVADAYKDKNNITSTTVSQPLVICEK